MHSLGICHGDVKPFNINLSDDQAPVLMLPEPSALKAGVAGTPAYMAPELVAGQRLEGRSDIYSLGVILYEMLCERPPFAESVIWERLRRLREEEPIPPRQLVPAIPIEIEAICLKAMAKRVNDRYTTAADLTADLQDWLAGSPATGAPAIQQQGRPIARGWTKAVLLALAAAAVLAGLLALRSFF
jgi:serine/threonine protein kinase